MAGSPAGAAGPETDFRAGIARRNGPAAGWAVSGRALTIGLSNLLPSETVRGLAAEAEAAAGARGAAGPASGVTDAAGDWLAVAAGASDG